MSSPVSSSTSDLRTRRVIHALLVAIPLLLIMLLLWASAPPRATAQEGPAADEPKNDDKGADDAPAARDAAPAGV